MPIVSMFWKTYASGGAVPSRSAATKSPSCTCGCATLCSTWSHSPARKVAADAGDGGPARSTPSLGHRRHSLAMKASLSSSSAGETRSGGPRRAYGEAKRDPVATELAPNRSSSSCRSPSAIDACHPGLPARPRMINGVSAPAQRFAICPRLRALASTAGIEQCDTVCEGECDVLCRHPRSGSVQAPSTAGVAGCPSFTVAMVPVPHV